MTGLHGSRSRAVTDMAAELDDRNVQITDGVVMADIERRDIGVSWDRCLVAHVGELDDGISTGRTGRCRRTVLDLYDPTGHADVDELCHRLARVAALADRLHNPLRVPEAGGYPALVHDEDCVSRHQIGTGDGKPRGRRGRGW
ncbi:hypothetical protein [Aureimonas glaciei]|uniref:hypothetical protein n=1 Tax=Aureimonas glaciei TaxID=1776957 RepID=UPI001667FA1D|nr:hypothetical protein [Aureimonas glaciei]